MTGCRSGGLPRELAERRLPESRRGGLQLATASTTLDVVDSDWGTTEINRT